MARTVRRDDAALLIVDVQEKLAASMERREEVLASTARLLRVAELLEWPVLVTRQYPKGLGDLDAELRDALAAHAPEAVVVDKTAFCCLAEPGFAVALAETGRPQVVVTGMETHICVTQTVLALIDDGREPFVVADACCSRRPSDHETALARMRAEGAVVTTAESVMYEAVGEAATDEFRALLRIVKDA